MKQVTRWIFGTTRLDTISTTAAILTLGGLVTNLVLGKDVTASDVTLAVSTATGLLLIGKDANLEQSGK
jgi:hypothetical protein